MITEQLSLRELLIEYFIKGGCFHFRSLYELREKHKMICDHKQAYLQKLLDRRRTVWRSIRMERRYRFRLRQNLRLAALNRNKVGVTRDWISEIRASHDKTRTLIRERNNLKIALDQEITLTKVYSPLISLR